MTRASCAAGEAVPASQPDLTELEARIAEATQHDGDLQVAVRSLTEDLDRAALVRTLVIALGRLRLAYREVTRAQDLVTEVRDHLDDGAAWSTAQALEEIELHLARAAR